MKFFINFFRILIFLLETLLGHRRVYQNRKPIRDGYSKKNRFFQRKNLRY